MRLKTISRKVGARVRPTSRPVKEWSAWDTTLPSTFPEIDVEARKAQADLELDRLLRSNAVDGAHGDVLDSIVAELFAPDHETAQVKFNEGLRVLLMMDGQAVEACSKAFANAENLAAAAKTLEVSADAVFLEHVGHERVKTGREGTVDWGVEANKWRDRRLALEADKGILDFIRRTFRGVGPIPTAPTGTPNGIATPGDQDSDSDDPDGNASGVTSRRPPAPPVNPFGRLAAVEASSPASASM
jgi:hypothetical protein